MQDKIYPLCPRCGSPMYEHSRGTDKWEAACTDPACAFRVDGDRVYIELFPDRERSNAAFREMAKALLVLWAPTWRRVDFERRKCQCGSWAQLYRLTWSTCGEGMCLRCVMASAPTWTNSQFGVVFSINLGSGGQVTGSTELKIERGQDPRRSNFGIRAKPRGTVRR